MPGTSTEPVVDKGIRQKSIHSFHSVHSFPDGSAFCPGAPKRVPSDSEKHRRVYTSSNVCHSHEWRVDTASGLTLKKQNACLHAVRHAVGKKIACIHGLRSEGVNSDNEISYPARCIQLGLPFLLNRIHFLSISFVIKCLCNCFDIDVHRYIKVNTRHVETVKFHHQRSRTNALHTCIIHSSTDFLDCGKVCL